MLLQEHPLIDVITFAAAIRLLRNGDGPCRGVVLSALPRDDELTNLIALLYETATTSTMLDPGRSIEAECRAAIRQVDTVGA